MKTMAMMEGRTTSNAILGGILKSFNTPVWEIVIKYASQIRPRAKYPMISLGFPAYFNIPTTMANAITDKA
jgi:hypothetical protein